MAQESCNLDKEEAEILKPSSSSSSPSPPPPPPPPSSSSSPTSMNPSQQFPVQRTERPETPAVDAAFSISCTPKSEEEPRLPVRFGNRCSSCQKRVRLTGFRCRCGDLFCPRHRYSSTHDCSFDYKAAGREEISRANPVIKAAKIIRI